ncbi:unnamed protein product [Moneuplotes crassus]|uniref:Uncharacterized protein n=1 Tax=Euplotes crassus TaxID=5936 RepID=A0AAD1U595_EUPCR|nr:unnamed protein product [Moneuplotes crassus]
MRHANFTVSSFIENNKVDDSLSEYSEGIKKCYFSFIKDDSTISSEDNRASFAFTSCEIYDLVFSDHHLVYELAISERGIFWVIKDRENKDSKDCRESLSFIKVSMLNGHDSLISHELFRVVVHQLSVDEDVWLVGQNFLNLLLHLSSQVFQFQLLSVCIQI